MIQRHQWTKLQECAVLWQICLILLFPLTDEWVKVPSKHILICYRNYNILWDGPFDFWYFLGKTNILQAYLHQEKIMLISPSAWKGWKQNSCLHPQHSPTLPQSQMVHPLVKQLCLNSIKLSNGKINVPLVSDASTHFSSKLDKIIFLFHCIAHSGLSEPISLRPSISVWQ